MSKCDRMNAIWFTIVMIHCNMPVPIVPMIIVVVRSYFWPLRVKLSRQIAIGIERYMSAYCRINVMEYVLFRNEHNWTFFCVLLTFFRTFYWSIHPINVTFSKCCRLQVHVYINTFRSCKTIKPWNIIWPLNIHSSMWSLFVVNKSFTITTMMNSCIFICICDNVGIYL